MKSLEQIITPIAAELAQFEAFFSQTLKADTEPMDTIMRYVLETKGKRLRPMLVLLSAKLFGKPNEKTLRAATFTEMVHSATLIHDDIVDGSDTRRGKASVNARWDAPSAVLAGDYLLAKAMLLIANDTDILNEMLQTTMAMSEGELMQNAVGLSYNGSSLGNCNTNGCHDVTALQTQYLNIITRKTALLMRSCCAAGAISVDATPEQTQRISAFGLCFGQLFQMRDDILDNDKNKALAESLLPEYQQKALDLLQNLPNTEIQRTLKDLVVFCAERSA